VIAFSLNLLPNLLWAAPPEIDYAAQSQRKLLAGEPLVFDAQSTESARTVNAAWIREAVSKRDPLKVEIANAVIAGPLDLSQIVAARPIILRGCRAEQRPNFSYSVFKDRVVLSGCVFASGATFQNAIFERDVSLEGTEFRNGPANFLDVLFQETFEGTGLHFLPDSRADFMRATFARTAQFQHAVFEAEANFASVHFRGQGLFHNVRFKEEAVFVNVLADWDISFRGYLHPDQTEVPGARFEGDADFSGGRFLGSVEFYGTTFKKKLSFNSAEIGGNAFFTHDADNGIPGPKFEGDADFQSVRFGKSAEFAGTVFKGKANFDSVRIEHYAEFSGMGKKSLRGERKEAAYVHGARFEGEADFSGATIGAEAHFQDAVFRQKARFIGTKITGAAAFHASPETEMAAALFEGEADFSYMQIGGSAYFGGTTFKGLAIFAAIDIRGEAVFAGELDPDKPDLIKVPGAVFEKGANFIVAHVGGQAEFQGAKFGADANFYRTRFDGNLGFYALKKGAPTLFAGMANFEDAHISGNALFYGAIFKKKAAFSGTQLDSVALFYSDEITGPTVFNGPAEFIETRFGRNAFFSNTVFEDTAVFDHSRCDGMLDFNRALFRQGISLEEAVVRILRFSRDGRSSAGAGTEAQFQGGVDLRGCSYERLYEQIDSDTNWRSLTKRFSPYDRQPYRQLEKAFRSAGQDEVADMVFLEQQEIERELKWNQGDREGWFFKSLHRYLLNYGVRPYRLVVFAAVLLALGWWIFFQPGALEKKNGGGAQLRVSWRDAIGVTLRYFFPIDVVMGSRFVASHQAVPLFKRVRERNWPPRIRPTMYATILQIAGWILLPLSIAALAGFLKVT
jgi:uncharacterized protein YjbI with pentapeptide repeats